MNHLSLKRFLNKKPNKLHLLVLLFVAVTAVAGLVGTESFNVPVANASPVNMAITGNAWSSNVGWISFSGTIANSKQTYGVYENPTTGVLSGYAWAYSSPDSTNPTQPSGLGWLHFGVSNGSHSAATVDFSQGSPTTGYKITGYARFISAGISGNPWGSPTMGWVSLSGNATNGSSYGITQKPNCTWSGYAWGPTNTGWVQTSGTAQSGTGYGVKGATSSVCTHSPTPAPTCTLYASPPSVQKGNHSTLIYTTSNATSFSVNNGVGTLPPDANGSKYVYPAVTTTYIGNVTGAGGTATCGTGASSKVTVTASLPATPPTGTLIAYPSRVEEGKTTPIKFIWTLTNVTSKNDACYITKHSMGAPVAREFHVGGRMSLPVTFSNPKTKNTDIISDSIKTQTKYYIKCNGKVVSNSVIINVVPTFSNF